MVRAEHEGASEASGGRGWRCRSRSPRRGEARRLPTIVMETLGGFPNLPAMVRAEQSSAAPHAFCLARAKFQLVRLMNNAG